MGRKTLLWGVVLLLGLGLALVATQPAWAQEPTPTPVIVEALEDPVTIYATYPEMVIGVDEKATFDLTLKVTKAQKVQLEVANLPEGWEYEFRGGVRTVRAVYALPDDSLNLRLQVTPAKEAAAGDYTFEVVAKGEYGEARFPLTITIKEKTPPKLELKVDLPTLKGSPNTNFRFGLTTAIVDPDLQAIARQCFRDLGSDTPTRSRDQHVLSAKLHRYSFENLIDFIVRSEMRPSPPVFPVPSTPGPSARCY